jgi:serine protease
MPWALMRRGPTLLALLTLLPGAAARAALPFEETVPGHLVVRYRGASRARLVHAPADAFLRLAADPAVAWVEPEHIRRRTTIATNDPWFGKQWSLALAKVPDAWSRSTGSPDVVVAVLDSGIRPHPDLEERYLPGWDFVANADNAGDGDGRDADPTDPGTPDESSSALHGMHVAGIVGAHTDNAVGIAGVDWGCKILPVRVLGVQGAKGTDSDIADAIRWAAGIHVDGVPDNPTPAHVINMSFSGPGGSRTIQEAIDEANQRKVIIVAAAGNDGADTAAYAPAGLTHVIAVGAVDQGGRQAYYSNRGARVDLVAPGGDLSAGAGVVSTLWSAADGYTYVPYNGTSQAAPHVAGVAALMKALDPTLDGDRARDILTRSADHRYQCAEGCGGGLLHADAALAVVEANCADGHCVPPGPQLIGGCNLSRRGSGLGLVVTLLLALGLLAARRRV